MNHLGYSQEQISQIITYVIGTSSLTGAPHINRQTLASKGMRETRLQKIEDMLPSVFELSHAFSAYTLGEECLRRLGLNEKQWSAPGLQPAAHAGLHARSRSPKPTTTSAA